MKTLPTIKEFLEDSPSGVRVEVQNFYSHNGNVTRKEAPVLRLKCTSETCNGVRNFDGNWKNDQSVGTVDSPANDFLFYKCRDCGGNRRVFAVASYPSKETDFKTTIIYKYGQTPDITMDLPNGLSELLGDDYKFFEQGIRSEKRGLGIGALTYYRRVVENQKGALIEAIIKVMEKLGGREGDIEILKKASKMVSFKKAIDEIKEHIPESIRIEGQNPLTALHTALSIGVHNSTDAECLEIADTIREILCELCRKLKAALQEKKKLKDAMANLGKFSNPPASKSELP